MTMDYLLTDSGYLLAAHVVLIEKAQTRGKKLTHKVHYQIGAEARETWAADDDVEEFLA